MVCVTALFYRMVASVAKTYSILLFFILICSCKAANEFFVYLTQEDGVNGSYYLHYLNGSNRNSWTTLPVPSTIQNIEDVEFNYITNVFYFSSSLPGNKGIWKGSIDLQNHYKSHQLREETTPLTIRAYPGFDVAFVYDAGYQSILAISLRNEKEDLRIKSLFERAEGLVGTFFLDTVKNRLIAENASSTIFTSKLNGSHFRSEFTLPLQYKEGTKLMAYDNYDTTLHYCVNSTLLGMKIEGHDPVPASKVPCAPLVASRGVLYYTNTTSFCVMKLSYNMSGVTILDDCYLRPSFNMTSSKIISFKRYEYEDAGSNMCNSLKCGHICVPDDKGKATCACTDYYVANTYANGTTTCVKETLHSLGLIYAVSMVPNNTLFYRLEGDPALWIRRPQREQLFTIRSGIVGLVVDWDQQRLLIAETQYRQIASAKMDGTFGTLAHYAGLSIGVKSIAYDWVGGNVVWFDPVFKWLRIVPLTDYHSNLMQRSPDAALSSFFSLSSTSIYKTALASSELEGYSLSLDAEAGYLFFLDRDDVDGSIHLWRTLMDGSDASKIFSFPPTVFNNDNSDNDPDLPLPGALTVDYFKKRIWAAFSANVFAFDYDGKQIAKFNIAPLNFTVDNSRVGSVQIYQSKFLFMAITDEATEQSTMFVYAITPFDDGSCCADLELRHNRTFNGEFRAMTTYQETPPITSKLNCSSANCQFMCTNINGSATCICPDGYSWNDTLTDCVMNYTVPASPVIVYNTQEKICHRSLDTIGQPTNSISSSLFDADYCFQNGKKLYSIMEPDHFSYRIYAVQQNHMPAAIYNLRLRQASRVFEWISLPSLGLLTESTPDEWDVFYSGNTVVALAFDWLGRNLYIADQSSRSLVVLRDNYYYPTLIQEDVNITSMVVDAHRRKLYWSTYSNVTGKTTISQRNLDASGDCLVAELDAQVVQMQIAYSNTTLLFLEQPTNRIGIFQLRSLPPFSSCNQPVPQYVNIQLANISQFAVYQRMAIFTSSSTNDLKLYTSTSLGAVMDPPIQLRKMAMPSSSMRGPIKSVAVVNPYLLSDSDNTTNPSDKSDLDMCAALDHGRCEHLCLASWDGVVTDVTNSHCACTDGMVLLKDKRHCAPRPIDLLNEGGIISVDDYHHKIFMLPLKTLKDGKMSFTVQNNLSALFIHAKARPYSVAFDAVTSEIYFGDHERGSIIRVNPQAQMARDPNQGHMEETIVHLGNKVYGLFIDHDSRLLYYTHREGHYLAVYDMEAKISAPIYTANQYTSIYGVTMDRRVDRMHIYVATRNVSTTPSPSSPSFVPSTWSAIVRCMPNGGNCLTVVNFTEYGAEKTKAVPWIYELSIDYAADRLYFSTGQNRSIMYIDLKDTSGKPKPQIFATEGGDKDPSFIYGVQVYGDNLLASDWQHRGIHVFDLKTQKKKGVIGGSFFTGLNGIAVFSKEHEDSGNFSQACVHTEATKYCSHICVPMPNNKRACKCPLNGDPQDGVNCKGVLACPRPDAIFGSFEDDCTLRPNVTCRFTCATGPQMLPGSGGKSYPFKCVANGATSAQWAPGIEGICLLLPTTPKPTTLSTTTSPGASVKPPQSTTTKATTKKKTTPEGYEEKTTTVMDETASKTTTTTLRTFPFLTPLPNSLDRKTDDAGGSSSSTSTTTGIIVVIVVVVIMLVGTIVGLFVYFRRRPNARGFRRLDDPPGGGNLITGSAAVASGVPPGTVAFRNPMFGMEDIDNVTVIDPRLQQQQTQQQQPTGGTQSHQQSGPREGQVVIF